MGKRVRLYTENIKAFVTLNLSVNVPKPKTWVSINNVEENK